VREAGRQAFQVHLCLHLRARAVHDDETDTHRMQQAQIMHERVEQSGFDQLTDERDNECFASMRMHIGCYVAQPCDELRVGGIDERGRQRTIGVVHARHYICRPSCAPEIARHA
jgi:hypothetical protein